MKKAAVLLALLMLLSGCTGCAAQSTQTAQVTQAEQTAQSEETTGTITVTDHDGNTVELPAQIERIAVCGIYPLPSVLSVFFNSAEKIVAMPEPSMSAAKNSLLGQLYPEILNAQTACVSGEQINVEELGTLEPDVVFYDASQRAMGDTLRAAGFKAVAVSVNKWDYDCIETLNQWIALLGEIFPHDAKAELVAKKSEEIYSLVQTRLASPDAPQRPRIFVLFQYSDAVMLSSGRHFFGQWWCDALGATNVAGELENDNSVAVDMEQVYAWNPEVILLTNFTKAQPEDLYANTVGADDWSGIDAVQNRRVYKMPLGLYRGYTPGADAPITLLWLAKSLYPGLFEDIDLRAETVEYYAEVFGVTLSDAQADSIFAPVADAAAGF